MIVARNLTQTYRSGERTLTVLDDVDLEIEAGAHVAVVGPSGSGKTTLLGLLAGLDLPARGAVWLDGTRLDALDEDGRARLRAEKVGFVFQTFQLIPTLSAAENVTIPLELSPDRRGANGEGGSFRERAISLLDRVGLADRADHYPAQLSGGEQQRVAIARAFAHAPRLLFADEPTGNLDARTGHGVAELLGSLNQEAGTTLLLVTHDPELAGRAERVIRLDAGRVVEDGG